MVAFTVGSVLFVVNLLLHFQNTLCSNGEVLQLHYPSVTVAAQESGNLSVQTKNNGDINIKPGINGSAVFFEGDNLLNIINIVLSLPPIWMNHSDMSYIGTIDGLKSIDVPLKVIVPGGGNVSFEIVAGDLPPGVRLDPLKKTISGIVPDVDAEYVFTIRAKSSHGKFADAVFQLDTREANQCENEPCQNNAICSDTKDGLGFVCHCRTPFGGQHCHIDCRLNDMGLNQQSVIPDAHFSSFLSRNQSHATEARFHSNSSTGWCGENANSWLQVDLGKESNVYAISTKAQTSDRYTKTYTLSYSTDGTSFTDVHDLYNGTVHTFRSSIGSLTQTLPSPISGRFIRLHPKSYKTHPCIKMELYGCTL